MAKNTNNAQEFEYKAEIKQLLHLIIHSLYTHPEVFLRELISNSSDALNKVRFRLLTDKENTLDPETPLEIRIEVDAKKNTFSIEDTGIGMTKEDLINNIGTVARSGTLEFLKKMQKENKPISDSLIGKFGLGFYSVFMVTDQVIIDTRYAEKDTESYRWQSSGEGTFNIQPSDRKKKGTKIFFKLKDKTKQFSEESVINSIITKYSNFADFPILVNRKKVNTVSALWYKQSKEITESELTEFYKFIANDAKPALGHIHLSLEGSVNFKALLFIPQTAPVNLLQLQEEKSIHLYSEKILIQDDCKEIIPEYLRFIKGAVDTKDLPLNVSRETIQQAPEIAKIKSVLTKKVLSYLEGLSKNQPEKYKTFYKNFGALLKTGINTDFANRDKIIALLRFESSLKPQGEFISLKDYTQKMKPDQTHIYYLSGQDRRTLENNPNLEYFKKHNIEVLLLTDPVDIFTLPSIGEYDKKTIESIEKANLDLKPEDKIERPDVNLDKELLSLFKAELNNDVAEVKISKRLVDSPVTLVAGKESMDSQMERMMKMMHKEYKGTKKILEINIDHPLIRNLSKLAMLDNKNPLIKKCIRQLYAGALFVEGENPSPTDFVRRMTEIMQQATK